MVNLENNQSIDSVGMVLEELEAGRVSNALQVLRGLVERCYADIPAQKRSSRGITWVVEQVGRQLFAASAEPAKIPEYARRIMGNLPDGDHVKGVPVFLMAEYGQEHADEVLDFFEHAGQDQDWVVRECAAGAFRKVIAANQDRLLPWLQRLAVSDSPNLRRFASETLRPVTANRWLNGRPDYSLGVLRLLFHESHPYPRTSVGNNLSDLSRRQPELVFSLVQELVATQDPDSYWIAYRACRNLVKQDPGRVMDLLRVDEYNYKDRNYYRQPE